MTIYERPWQQGPAELIKYAIEHIYMEAGNKDFNNRMAFLLFDIGVETLFKVYLSLPEEVTKGNVNYTVRSNAIKASFYDLIKTVKMNAGNKVKDINLNDILYYHNIRNKLYHETDSITVPIETVKGYASIVIKLLKILLEVDLSEAYYKPDIELQKQAEIKSLERRKNQFINRLFLLLERCLELIEPKLLLPSFKDLVDDLQLTNTTTPIIAVRESCKRIEDYFGVDMNQCFSTADKAIVNKHLQETLGKNLADYPSPKEIIMGVMSGLDYWEGLAFNNIPVGNYMINSLSLDDFVTNGHSNLDNIYFKIVWEIVNLEDLQEKIKEKTEVDECSLFSTYINKDIPILEEETTDEVVERLSYEIDNLQTVYDIISDWEKEHMNK